MHDKMTPTSSRQYGAFTAEQALTLHSPKQIRVRVARGDWCRVFHGVFRHASTPPDAALRTVAAELCLGCKVVACRDTAAQLHGFDILDDPTTHVLAARMFSTQVKGMAVHREQLSNGDAVVVNGLWATSPARTAVDLARSYGRMDALAVLDAALRLGVDHAGLTAELLRHTGKRGYRQAREMLGYATGKAESPMESRTLIRCIDAGLPIPEQQLYVPIPLGANRWLDLAWPEWKIGLEYESSDWHTGQAAVSRDNPRHNWLTRNGWTMYYATPRMVYKRPSDFTGPILDHIAQASR